MIRLRFRGAGGRRLEPGALLAMWSRFWPWLSRSRGILAGAFASTLAFTVLQIARPWPLKFALDAVVGGAPPAGGPLGFAAVWPAERIVAAAAIGILAIAGLSAVAAFGQRYLGAKTGQLLAYRVRRDLFRHLHRLSLAEHGRAKRGDLLLRLTADMNLVRNLLVRATLRLLAQSLVVAGAAALLLALDWRLGLAALAIVPPLALTAGRSSRRIRAAVRKQRDRESEVAAAASESLQSVAVVKLHRAEETELERFRSSHRKSFRLGLRATRLQAALERNVELLVALGTCLVLWIGARRALDGALTAGDLVLAISYLGMVAKPVRTFSRLVGRLAKGVVAAERVLDLFDRAPEELHRSGALVPEETRGRLEMRGVRFSYGDEPVLRFVDLTIEPGERVALVGRSGAGKTTLVRLVPRLFEPLRGEILLDGVPLPEIELAALRDRISFVLQETVLLGLSVWDNIAYGRDDLDEERIFEAARRARIHERVLRLPKGYDTLLSEGGAGLSGGERQRVALARAFARSTPIVILDEPDSFLDERVKEELWESIDEVTRGRTAIVIAHDARRIGFVDRIAVLDEGRIVATGTAGELLATCPLYRELAGAGEPLLAPSREVRGGTV